MTLPNLQTLYDVVETTWPAAATQTIGPWTIRDGQGGGSRVSAATANGSVADTDIPTAADAMKQLGQRPIFMIRADYGALDSSLHKLGYIIKDPVKVFAAPVDLIATERPPPVTSFEVWPPLAVQTELWAAGDIGPARLAVMDRAAHPKTTLLGRSNDRPAGALFIGMAKGCAMVHALEIAPAFRRQGLARHLTRSAAFWARAQGAKYLTVLATVANEPAQALYSSLGMTVVGQYHYRTLPE